MLSRELLGRQPTSGPPMIHAPWSGQGGVFAISSTRIGGCSHGPYDDGSGGPGLNLGQHVGDQPTAVMANRARLETLLPARPLWLNQVHGADVLDASDIPVAGDPEDPEPPTADGVVSNGPRQVLAIMTADCLPVLFTDRLAGVIGAAHAGWRGLAAGVLQTTLLRMVELGARRDAIAAWIGPGIGPTAFEVGGEVPEAFSAASAFDGVDTDAFFVPVGSNPEKSLGDLPGLAEAQMKANGLVNVTKSQCCTATDPRFYSYRRDGRTGRMASLIWQENG